MEGGTRRIVHCNVTAHATATWTLQQLREAIPRDHSYRFLIHERDAIFSAEVDQQLKAFGLEPRTGLLNLPRYSYRCKVTTDTPSPKSARSRLARFSVASITNTGGKGSRRKGKKELSGHSALLASPQFLVAVRVGLPVPSVCNETHELGEELVGPYRYKVQLLHWLESNNYGVFLSDSDLYIKS